MSSSGEEYFSDGSGDDFSAECVDEYSVDSDGNIKPEADAPPLPKSSLKSPASDKDSSKPSLTPEERRK